MTLHEAIEMIEIEYENAKKLEYVKNPLAFALYKVWKMADNRNRNKGGNQREWKK